jgi:pyruvate-formate lyase
LSFVKVVDHCLHRDLMSANDFHEFMAAVNTEIQREIDTMTRKFINIFMEPSPFLSLLMDDCVASAQDISAGAKYNNYGLHGTGLANAADSLAVIKKYVFEKREITPQNLIQAIDANFEGYENLWATVRQDELKMGNDMDEVDRIGGELLTMFANALAGRTNDRGGCYRAGTGAAMYYLWHAKDVGASPDGRKKGEPLSANYSPALRVKTKGPISIIKSFTKPDLTQVINGGPLTLELHDSVFRNAESIQKVAMLVKSYVDMGGHQLQLNTVNRETLLHAQRHPEQHRNVIVRVWGWSGYFVELDKEYQDHIIQRAELKI